MKTNIIIKILLVMILLLAGCTTTQQQDFSGTEAVSGTTVVLSVYGMSCPLCSNNLDGQLEKIDGVESVKINLDTGAVNVGFSEAHSVTEQQLATAVRAAGFTLNEIRVK